MSEEPNSQPRISRRNALGATGALGVLFVLGGGEIGRALAATSTATTKTTTTDCTLMEPGEQGPFFVDGQKERSNVRTDFSTGTAQAGVPVKLHVTLYDESAEADACTSPLVGARVDIWSANRAGVYSDESSESTSGEDWLRGYQLTDSAGKITFETIYPGWYAGRTNHIHLRIRTYSSDGTTVESDFLTQLFFDATTQAAIHDQYSLYDSNDYTERDSDRVYQSELAYGHANVMSLTGSTTEGFVATFAGSPNASGTKTKSASHVEATVESVTVSRISSTRRRVTVKLDAKETVTAKLALVKAGKVVAEQSTATSAAAGRDTLQMEFNNSVGHGAGVVYVALQDAAYNPPQHQGRHQDPDIAHHSSEPRCG